MRKSIEMDRNPMTVSRILVAGNWDGIDGYDGGGGVMSDCPPTIIANA